MNRVTKWHLATGVSGRRFLPYRRRVIQVIGVAGMVVLGLATGCAGTESTQPVATNEVRMPPSYRFDPVVIQIQAGTTVTWSNNDNFTHSVRFGDGVVHNLTPGASVSLPFATPGEFLYVCTYHAQNMKGTVMVTAR